MSERIALTCHTCGEGIDIPNKGLGRAIAAAWSTRHQGHDVQDEVQA